MKLTIREALEMTPLKCAKVLAGEENLDREIQSVNIVEVPDTVRWMRGGEIMFSSGFAFSGDAEKGVALLSSLCSHNIAALVLKPGVYMSRIPEAMIRYAARIGFPLLEVPGDMPFNTCMEAIYALLLDKQTVLFGSDAVSVLDAAGSGALPGELRNACQILADRISTPVYYLAVTGAIKDFFTPAGSDAVDTMQPQLIVDWGKTHVLTQVCVDLEPRAYLAVEKHEGFPSQMDTAMMEYTALLVSTQLQKEQAFVEQKKRYRSALLDDLIAGNLGEPGMLRRRCELLQFDMKAPYLAFAISTRSDGSALGDSENLNTTRNYICNVLEHAVLHHTCSVLLTQRDERVIGVFSFPDQMNACVLARQILQDMLQNLSRACCHVHVSAGVSAQYAGPEFFGDAVREAVEALEVNVRLSWDRQLVNLEDLGVYRILCELRGSRAMREFCQTTLGAILESDNGEELLRTLESYYDNECNLRATSEALFLHKNSVKYRLSRIEQLLGKSIADPEEQLNLRLCLKYRQIM